MDVYGILFHLAAVRDGSFLKEDDQTTLLTMEANRIELDDVPDLYGDKLAFAKGYVMGREGMGRDPKLPEGTDRDYDLGYDRGRRVRKGRRRTPHWDQRPTAN
jgi:hypothetical protein